MVSMIVCVFVCVCIYSSSHILYIILVRFQAVKQIWKLKLSNDGDGN